MESPDWKSAYVPVRKITGYLLSDSHELGRSKAHFFKSVGYSLDRTDILSRDLKQIAVAHRVVAQIQIQYGTKFVLEGRLFSPNGVVVKVRTVWFVSNAYSRPRFVTAYPLKYNENSN